MKKSTHSAWTTIRDDAQVAVADVTEAPERISVTFYLPAPDTTALPQLFLTPAAARDLMEQLAVVLDEVDVGVLREMQAAAVVGADALGEHIANQE